MKNYMPTRVFTGTDILKQHKDVFSSLGRRCLIITSAHSGKTSGALDDLETVFKDLSVEYEVGVGDVMICEDGHGHGIRNVDEEVCRLTALIVLK